MRVAASDADRRRWLRCVERLRSGLPPSSAATRVTVGTDALSSEFVSFLRVEDQPGGAFLVLGDYGTGKSHTLTLLKELSLESGFATSWLTADGYDCALNHPQRFLASVLRTFETPAGDSGYAEFLNCFLANSANFELVREWILKELPEGTKLGHSARVLLAQLQGAESAGSRAEGAPEWLFRNHLIRLLAAETLIGAPGAESYRRYAYHLLSLANKVARLAGHQGLVVIVDEVESVFTKMGNARSRLGAFRVLAALAIGLKQPGLRVAFAITPDAEERFRKELSQDLSGFSNLPCEPIRSLRGALLNDLLPLWRCKPLSRTQFEELFHLVRAVYADAYPDAPMPASKTWGQSTGEILQRRPSTRIAVRDVLDHLDRCRLGIV